MPKTAKLVVALSPSALWVSEEQGRSKELTKKAKP